jgi:hypothetical protein
MIDNCIVCKTKLIPIIHRLDPDVLDMQDKGLALASLDKTYNSFCPLCEESYRDITGLPSQIDDHYIQNITFPQ